VRRAQVDGSPRSGACGGAAGVAWAVAALLVLGAPAFGQEPTEERRVSGEATFDVVSAYAWRGMHLSRGLVVQSLIAAESRGLAANLWWNFDPSEYPAGSGVRRRITETDITLSYGRGAGPGTLTGGFVYYNLRDVPDTLELFVGYEFDVALNPSATLYLDPDEGRGAFLLASLGRSVDLPRGADLDFEVEVGFNLGNQAMGTTADGRRWLGAYHSEVSASARIPIAQALAITSTVGLSVALGGRAGNAIAAASYDGMTRRFVFCSLGLTAAFGQEP
jgi:hypothetical protein